MRQRSLTHSLRNDDVDGVVQGAVALHGQNKISSLPVQHLGPPIGKSGSDENVPASELMPSRDRADTRSRA